MSVSRALGRTHYKKHQENFSKNKARCVSFEHMFGMSLERACYEGNGGLGTPQESDYGIQVRLYEDHVFIPHREISSPPTRTSGASRTAPPPGRQSRNLRARPCRQIRATNGRPTVRRSSARCVQHLGGGAQSRKSAATRF